MNYLVAVSGGVDSVVLLDMLSKTDHRLVVAHVDHGIRGDDSAADARFVEQLARQYEAPFVSTTLRLGAGASEDAARQARYQFLREQAAKFNAVIATAHHREDVIETIAINLLRGTGWRGLAVMETPGIARPLLALTKRQIYEYALKHRLEWVEDATNADDAYLRNRLRKRLGSAPSRLQSDCLRLRAKQLQLRREITRETARLIKTRPPSRHFFTQIDTAAGIELLGSYIQAKSGVRPIRPQLERALIALKTARPATVHDVGDAVQLHFTSRTFSVKRV